MKYIDVVITSLVVDCCSGYLHLCIINNEEGYMKLEFVCWKNKSDKWMIYLQSIVGIVTLGASPISYQFETREEALEWFKEIVGKEGITIKLPQ